MPSYTQSFTGRQGHVLVSGNVVPITKWTAKLTRELADSTDSANYNPADGQTWKSQQPGSIGIESTIEGNFDKATTSANIISQFKLDAAFPVTLSLDASTDFCSGNFDFESTEVSVEVPGSTMVTWSTTAKSSGIITLF